MSETVAHAANILIYHKKGILNIDLNACNILIDTTSNCFQVEAIHLIDFGQCYNRRKPVISQDDISHFALQYFSTQQVPFKQSENIFNWINRMCADIIARVRTEQEKNVFNSLLDRTTIVGEPLRNILEGSSFENFQAISSIDSRLWVS